jgi:hypothetical protein
MREKRIKLNARRKKKDSNFRENSALLNFILWILRELQPPMMAVGRQALP